MKPPAERTVADVDPSPAPPVSRRILLVDDHPLMRSGLRQLLDSEPDLEVAGETNDAAEALRFLAHATVDLVLTDLSLPGRGGLELIKDLQVLYPRLPILVLSMHDEALYAERVIRAGARGYLMKETGGERVLEAVRQVLDGCVYLSATMTTNLLSGLGGHGAQNSRSPFARLTDREMEVFQLVGRGKSTREIARLLNLSPKTVDVHRGHIKAKLELTDTTALIRHAVRWMESQ
jgi:DNA-binding NarL/FixJ family response regulator